MIRSTKMPGVWIWSGSSSPISTSCSTSATQTLPQLAIIGLKFREVFRKTRLPDLSPFHARVIADNGEALGAAVAQGGDEILRYAAQPEAARSDRHVIVEQAVKRSRGGGVDFAHVERD